jgi:hypothetical protein
MKKEELQIKVGKLEAKVLSYEKSDLEVRTQLSNLLGGKYKSKDVFSSYTNDRELIPYSWMEIAFEIGKLKKIKENVDLEEEIHTFMATSSSRFDDIYRDLENLKK